MSTLRSDRVQCAHGNFTELRSYLLEMFCLSMDMDTARFRATEAVSQPEMPSAAVAVKSRASRTAFGRAATGNAQAHLQARIHNLQLLQL